LPMRNWQKLRNHIPWTIKVVATMFSGESIMELPKILYLRKVCESRNKFLCELWASNCRRRILVG
jgi:hypothetical protein